MPHYDSLWEQPLWKIFAIRSASSAWRGKSPTTRREWISQIAAAPSQLRAALSGLSEEQLATPYRPGGWTLRQLAHHVPDSHMNSYVRFRLALTEEEPTIKPYQEDRWAELDDARTAPVEVSLALLDSLHARWVLLLRSLSAADWKPHVPASRTGADDAGDGTWRSMRGTDGITWRTSPRCANAWAGDRRSHRRVGRGRRDRRQRTGRRRAARWCCWSAGRG